MQDLFFHPKLVHLPMALAVLMPLLAAGLLFAWWKRWLPARVWIVVVAMQAILVASGFASLQSGEAEEDRVERVVAGSLVKAHEEAADAFVIASSVVLAAMVLALGLVWRRASRPLVPLASTGESPERPLTPLRLASPLQRAALAVGLVASLGTLPVLGLGYRTGQAGGALVYEHGAARAYGTSATTPGKAALADPVRKDDD